MPDVFGRRHARGWKDHHGVIHETKLVDNCRTKCGINTYEVINGTIEYEVSFHFTYDAPTCLLCVTHDETPKAKTDSST